MYYFNRISTFSLLFIFVIGSLSFIDVANSSEEQIAEDVSKTTVRNPLQQSPLPVFKLVKFSPTQIEALTPYAKVFFRNWHPPRQEKIAEDLMNSSPEQITAIGQAINDPADHFYLQYDTYGINTANMVNYLTRFEPNEIVVIGPTITTHAPHLFTADMDEDTDLKVTIIFRLLSLSPKQFETFVNHASNFFTPDMNGDERAKIIADLRDVSPDHIEELAQNLVTLQPELTKKYCTVITADARHFFKGKMSQQTGNRLAAALVQSAPETIYMVGFAVGQPICILSSLMSSMDGEDRAKIISSLLKLTPELVNHFIDSLPRDDTEESDRVKILEELLTKTGAHPLP